MFIICFYSGFLPESKGHQDAWFQVEKSYLKLHSSEWFFCCLEDFRLNLSFFWTEIDCCLQSWHLFNSSPKLIAICRLLDSHGKGAFRSRSCLRNWIGLQARNFYASTSWFSSGLTISFFPWPDGRRSALKLVLEIAIVTHSEEKHSSAAKGALISLINQR